MERIALRQIERQYANNGQHAEQTFVFTMSGMLRKADNKPAEECGDYLDIQIKSARASVCKGLDIDAYLALDAAKRYAYVSADFSIAYIMTKEEWRAFVKQFAKPAIESAKNGGSAKMRLPTETKAVREWLERG